MQDWSEIRRKVQVEGVSKREILRRYGIHWTTLEKILGHPMPPGYRRASPRPKPRLEPHIEWLERVLELDKRIPKKQRHTAKRLFERLRMECGYTGGYTVVKDFVREYKRTHREVFLPLAHLPGEAQVDFFEALAKIGGVLQKVHVFCMALPYSDLFFVKAYPRECSEAFFDGHVEAFRFFGGVPRRISYDNLKIAVLAFKGCHKRKLTDGFLSLASHYLFDPYFCTVRRPNEKGVVEGLAKYARSNFLVPVPQVKDYAALNVGLESHCESERARQLRGKSAPKGDLFSEDRAAFLLLPVVPFEACKRASTRANSLSLVRFDGNDYSVPVAQAHHEVTLKGFVDRVEVFTRAGERIASHTRIWAKERVSYQPEHYLPLLVRKPGALDHAVPFLGLQLPDCFETLRRKLEAQEGHQGTKDYIAVLCLLVDHSLTRVTRAIQRALPLSYPTVDVIKQYAFPEERPTVSVFCLDGREHLKGVRVDAPDLTAYGCLVRAEVRV
jgi:transposase